MLGHDEDGADAEDENDGEEIESDHQQELEAKAAWLEDQDTAYQNQ